MLWLRVLSVSLADALGCGSALPHGLKRGKDQAQALEWIGSDYNTPGSFLWICHSLDLDPQAVRQALQRKVQSQSHDRINLVRKLGQIRPD